MTDPSQNFEEFFRAEHPKLFRIALGMTGEPEAAADAAQEALERALRDWSRVATLDVPGAWVRRVMLNLITDSTRRRRSERKALDSTGPRPAVLDNPSNEEWWLAVRQLPTRQRSATVLYYIEDQSIRTVAAAMECSEGTVKSLLHTARQSLASALTKENSK